MDYVIEILVRWSELAFAEHPFLTTIFLIIFAGMAYLFTGNRLVRNVRSIAIDHFTVKEQMKIAEKRLDDGEDSILGLYLRLRKEARGTKTGLILDPQVKCFRLLLKHLKRKAIKSIRHSFRENHLTERTNGEYEAWIDAKAEEIMRELREQLNSWYSSDAEPSVEQFYDAYVVEKRTEIKEGFKQTYREARRIALEFMDKKYTKKYIIRTSRELHR